MLRTENSTGFHSKSNMGLAQLWHVFSSPRWQFTYAIRGSAPPELNHNYSFDLPELIFPPFQIKTASKPQVRAIQGHDVSTQREGVEMERKCLPQKELISTSAGF